jgi:hypothetical protein
MSQLILDDQLDVHEVLEVIQEWITAQRLGDLRPGEHVLDDRVPEILLTLRQPTFVTIDHGFWDRQLCHAGYAILYFALTENHQEILPGLLRRLLRRPEFRTRASRMGKVARITPTGIAWWQLNDTVLYQMAWKGPSKK